ncbi:MAG: hypothetical protein U9O98_01470 [Asgard group archaeon]|nr:hypothetical protein [Asgard group archaeon]
MTNKNQYGKQRKYRRVIFFSILTFGLYYLFYQWWLFRDLQEHFLTTYEEETEAIPTRNNPTTMLIFLIFFPFYPIYLKYELLHRHILTSSVPTETNCPTALDAFLSIVLLCFCTFGIVPIIYEYRWQQAFNEHISAHRKLSEA